MINRIYEKSKNFIQESFRTILFFVLLYVVLMIPVDYYITIGGGTIDLKERVDVKNGYSSQGEMKLAYVTELQGNVATYLLSYVMPDWQRTDIDDYRMDSNEDKKSVDFRNRLELQESINNAIQVAYEKAGKSFTIKEEHLFVVYVTKKNKKNIHVGDEILEVNGEKIRDFDALKKMVNLFEVGEHIPITVLRNNKRKKVEVTVYQEEKEKRIGVSVSKSCEYETNPKVSLSFLASESGPSGGMMLTLDIYNKLTKKDLTKGYRIVGTGTISSDGKVGEIGGVKYKLMGAVRDGADIFLVPSGENFREARKVAQQKKYTLKIIPVQTIDDAILALEKLKKK